MSTPVWAHAQATGQINGAVTDSSGAFLPGVTIEATNTATGAVRTAVTGTDGLYTIPLLPPGNYTVKASLQGFRVSQRDGVRVTVTETARVAFQLEVGQLSETITVIAEATLVETSNATHGIVIDEQKVVGPAAQRAQLHAARHADSRRGGAAGGLGGQSGDATPGGFGNATGGFNVNGMRNQSNNFLMDGATNNDTFNTGFVLRPPPDAIEEFKILTHAFGAEYGRNAGSVVNVVTKSGTNTLSGSLWEFNRDDALQARNYFAPQTQPKPELKQNQFGGSDGRSGAAQPAVRVRLLRGLSQRQRHHAEHRRALGGAAPRRLLRRRGDPRSAHRAALPRQHHSGEPHQPAGTQLLNDFVPLPNSPGNRYIVSPTVRTSRPIRHPVRLSPRCATRRCSAATCAATPTA